MISKITALLKNKKYFYVFVAVLLIAGLLLYFASQKSTEKTESKTDFNSDLYVKELEEKIKTISETISGVTANVSLTVESKSEYVYRDAVTVANEKSEQDYIIVKNRGGGEEGLLVTEKMPQIRGVVVVVKGANSNSCEQIKASLAALLNIRNSKIYVTY